MHTLWWRKSRAREGIVACLGLHSRQAGQPSSQALSCLHRGCTLVDENTWVCDLHCRQKCSREGTPGGRLSWGLRERCLGWGRSSPSSRQRRERAQGEGACLGCGRQECWALVCHSGLVSFISCWLLCGFFILSKPPGPLCLHHLPAMAGQMAFLSCVFDS